jgi:adenosylmethionine-8-amino-7-oxononanoate aminotransferase
MLRMAYERERQFCEDKAQMIEALSGEPMEQLLHGVTYDANGMGGSYGGMPRVGRSLLDGILDMHSDGDTDDDNGSEATDLADSDAEYQQQCVPDDEPVGEVAAVKAEVLQGGGAAMEVDAPA